MREALLVLGELVREQCRGERAPRALLVGEERVESGGSGRQVVRRRAEPPKCRPELGSPRGIVEVRGETGDRPVLERELSPQVAAGGEHEQRAPHCGCKLVGVELDAVPGDEREHRRGSVRLSLPYVGLEVLEDLAVRVHRPRVRSGEMQDVLRQLERWLEAGEKAAMATVVGTRRSAPRPLGSRLAVSESGAMLGSVSGGCVEADVAREAQQALAENRPRLLSYGIEDETAQSVGLPCGGEIDVFVVPVADVSLLRRIREILERGERATLATVVDGGRAGDIELSPDGQGGSRPVLEERDGSRVFVEPLRPPPLLVCVGATDLAEALTRLARDLGWRTVVTDARRALLTRERLPSAGELIGGWPEESLAQAGVGDDTAVVVLSHDEKLDVPALSWALGSEAFYVGVLGSRRRQEKLRQRLEEAGVAETSRLAGPAGLDLGAHAVEETALSILAEIVAVREGRAGGRLRDAEAAIHS